MKLNKEKSKEIIITFAKNGNFRNPLPNIKIEWVTGKILKFSDDIKLFRKTKENGENKNYKMTLIT